MRKLIASALAILLGLGAANADVADSTSSEHARRLAVGVCGTCHGAQGISEMPKFPRLAAQSSNYLAAQLKAFRAQTRGDPDAIGYMWGMAGTLDDGTIAALAEYYSGHKSVPPIPGDAVLIARGKDIYEKGVEAAGVPACAGCHGPDAHGMDNFPRLAGQHKQYVLKQLSSFQSNMREVAVMHGVAQRLEVKEMQAVAEYLQAQP
jgi:cytochrome c553